jgi:membrane protein required for colicin V production
MNFLDILFIIFIVWFAYQGFKRGFIIELASLAALVLGIYAALHFSDYAADILINNFDMGPKYVPLTAFIITFVVVIIVVFFIGKILEKLVNMVALGFLNKMAGLFFGILKAAVLISIVLLIINHFNDKLISKEKQKNSFLYAPISAIAPFLWQRLEDFKLHDSRMDSVKRNVDEVTI